MRVSPPVRKHGIINNSERQTYAIGRWWEYIDSHGGVERAAMLVPPSMSWLVVLPFPLKMAWSTVPTKGLIILWSHLEKTSPAISSCLKSFSVTLAQRQFPAFYWHESIAPCHCLDGQKWTWKFPIVYICTQYDSLCWLRWRIKVWRRAQI